MIYHLFAGVKRFWSCDFGLAEILSQQSLLSGGAMRDNQIGGMSRSAFLRGTGATLAGIALSDAFPAPETTADTPKITYLSDPTPSDSTRLLIGGGWAPAPPQVQLSLLPRGGDPTL